MKVAELETILLQQDVANRADLYCLSCRRRLAGKDAPPDKKGGIIKRMGLIRGYFQSPEPDEFYLSKMGLMQKARGRQLGRHLLDSFLAAGKSRGFSKYRLDVSRENGAARHLYDQAGFHVDLETTSSSVDMVYLSMTLE